MVVVGVIVGTRGISGVIMDGGGVNDGNGDVVLIWGMVTVVGGIVTVVGAGVAEDSEIRVGVTNCQVCLLTVLTH